MKIKKLKKINAFTLIEVLVASALSMVILGSLSSLVFSYTKLSTKDSIKLTIRENQRNAVRRIEKEIQEGRCAIGSYKSFTASSNTLIFTVPVFDSDSYPIQSDPCATTGNDVVVLSKDLDKLRFYRFADPASSKPSLSGSLLLKNITENNLTLETKPVYNIFSFINDSGVEITPPSGLDQTKMVKVSMCVSEKYSDQIISDYKEIYVRFLWKR